MQKNFGNLVDILHKLDIGCGIKNQFIRLLISFKNTKYMRF
mgnify:CR=1 FL=1